MYEDVGTNWVVSTVVKENLFSLLVYLLVRRYIRLNRLRLARLQPPAFIFAYLVSRPVLTRTFRPKMLKNLTKIENLSFCS